jgi:endonuclease/exonuclease/phosphatase family metal-dependent hydrolase
LHLLLQVGIAFRSSRYAAEGVDICRLSDTKPWPRPPKETGARAWLKAQLTTGIVARMLQALRRSQPAQDPWSYARGRFNALVFLRLRDRETRGDFGVACYHMPCAYWAPPVMTIHAALAAQRVAALAKDGLPYALAGDWNFTPTSPIYRLLTQGGEVPAGDPAAPVALPHDSWAARVDVPLMSAYAVAHGAEPEFTNHAVVRDQPPFIECLDYIFVSPTVEVLAADALPAKDEVKGPFPTASEPSDHMLLAATLRF